MSHAQQAMRDDDRVSFGYLGCREEVVPFYERTGWSRVNAVEPSCLDDRLERDGDIFGGADTRLLGRLGR